jgi:hypothetical protein
LHLGLEFGQQEKYKRQESAVVIEWPSAACWQIVVL